METKTPLYYSEYLHLDKILNAQHPKSAEGGKAAAHEEMLFIIVHQAFELWFKQVRHELSSIIDSLHKDRIDDNTDEMSMIVQRLYRIIKIIHLMNDQFEVLETMKPLNFLDFRRYLYPASGFQSKQFRMVEAMLGLKMGNRHMPEHYKNVKAHAGGFRQADYEEITMVENNLSVLEGVKNWLSRMPFFHPELWKEYNSLFPDQVASDNIFLSDYYHLYQQAQSELSSGSLKEYRAQQDATVPDANSNDTFRRLFMEQGSGMFSAKEMTAALFIQLYGQHPMLHLPFELINSLVEIDDLLSLWRYRHFSMVKKMIGSSPGTGGTDGAGYLFGAVQKNRVFADLLVLPTFFIEKSKLPVLPRKLKDLLEFSHGYSIEDFVGASA
ncbi:MAG TPA: tryptophan 2,3-dioxygenase family protein [Chitinophagaceae bacterium]